MAAPDDATEEGLLFAGSGPKGGPMDDLFPPTDGRAAEDSFLAGVPDGVPVRETDVDEVAVAALGRTGLVGDCMKVHVSGGSRSHDGQINIPSQCSTVGT